MITASLPTLGTRYLDHLPQPAGDGEQVQVGARQQLQLLLPQLRAAVEARLDQRRDPARQHEPLMRSEGLRSRDL